MPIAVSSEAGGTGKTVVTVSGHCYEDGSAVGALRYRMGASQAAPSLGDDLSAWSILTLTDGAAEMNATAGHKLVVAAVDGAGKAVAASATVTVVVGG